ncbi:hypothetical protein [Luteimonas terrae]|uniref:DUF2922 domain-containing protein n=1 Tax=Luteimonas terrae TaxID=1530191 RepID=A0ABU1XYN1_9GAMM|nr:hypothetical protein [Luteimonas terrae]MDR7193885.1 hypothetical protein [Luteimonas terrae]
MSTYTLQYDMGLRFWVLTDTQGQTLATYLSRATALRDEVVRGVIERGCILRIRNADGSYEPVDSPAALAPEAVAGLSGPVLATGAAAA